MELSLAFHVILCISSLAGLISARWVKYVQCGTSPNSRCKTTISTDQTKVIPSKTAFKKMIWIPKWKKVETTIKPTTTTPLKLTPLVNNNGNQDSVKSLLLLMVQKNHNGVVFHIVGVSLFAFGLLTAIFVSFFNAWFLRSK
ncbi:uncharacterized protein LOC130662313 [Hydractinia symbiolongicarpus]|uniref:uncharacterized protein LOC130662313 n=1 Tax=Hydractinia symbiolongicarpus TaxID=13093 RepID=UPI002551A359|nr:uncharacterized protein LOC130662313 [Hydractinia symbiolongicarpus]